MQVGALPSESCTKRFSETMNEQLKIQLALLRKLYSSNFKFGVNWSLSRSTVGAEITTVVLGDDIVQTGSYRWEVQAFCFMSLAEFQPQFLGPALGGF